MMAIVFPMHACGPARNVSVEYAPVHLGGRSSHRAGLNLEDQSRSIIVHLFPTMLQCVLFCIFTPDLFPRIDHSDLRSPKVSHQQTELPILSTYRYVENCPLRNEHAFNIICFCRLTESHRYRRHHAQPFFPTKFRAGEHRENLEKMSTAHNTIQPV